MEKTIKGVKYEFHEDIPFEKYLGLGDAADKNYMYKLAAALLKDYTYEQFMKLPTKTVIKLMDIIKEYTKDFRPVPKE